MVLGTKPFSSAMGAEAYVSLNKPSWFTKDVPFLVKRDVGAERFTTSLDIESYKCTPTNTYYVSNSGSSGNDGLTSGTAKRDVDQAIALGNASGAPYEIRVAAGTYNRQHDWSQTPTQDCNIIGEGSGSTLSAQEDGLSFTLTASNTYSTGRSAVAWVYDAKYIDGHGNYQKLTKVSSQTECEATVGSWAQVGGTLYVHAFDERNLSADSGDLKVFLKVNSPKISDDVHVYVENINIEGFQTTCFEARNNGSGHTPELYFNNVSLKYCYNGNGMSLNGVSRFIGYKVTTAHNGADGLNYHIRSTVIPSAYEIDCKHIDNGQELATNTNGSTMHDGGAIVRVNVFSTGASRNIHDVDDDTLSWNVDVRCGRSTSNVADTGAAFANGSTSGDNSLMGLYYCEALENQCPYDLLDSVGSTTYLVETTLPNQLGNGTVVG